MKNSIVIRTLTANIAKLVMACIVFSGFMSQYFVKAGGLDWADKVEAEKYTASEQYEGTEFIFKNIKYKIGVNGESQAVVMGYVDELSIPSCLYIPENIKSEGKIYHVKEIGDKAFYGCAKLKALSLPNTIVSIGKNAFCNSGLTYLILPGENLKLAGIDALYGTPINISGPGSAVYTIENAISEQIWKDLDIPKPSIYFIPRVPKVENIKYEVKGKNLEISWSPTTDAHGYIVNGPNADEGVVIHDAKYIEELVGQPEKYTYSIGAYIGYKSSSESPEDPFKSMDIKGQTREISVNIYEISIENNKDGKINSDQNFAVEGQNITLNIIPHKGYFSNQNSVTITPSNTKILKNDRETFIFTMPSENVNIKSQFFSDFASDDEDDKDDLIHTDPDNDENTSDLMDNLEQETNKKFPTGNLQDNPQENPKDIVDNNEFLKTSDNNQEIFAYLLILITLVFISLIIKKRTLYLQA